jgi:hypothetical protein
MLKSLNATLIFAFNKVTKMCRLKMELASTYSVNMTFCRLVNEFIANKSVVHWKIRANLLAHLKATERLNVSEQRTLGLIQWQLMEKFFADVRIKLASQPSCVGTAWREMVNTIQKCQNYIYAFITKELFLWNFWQSPTERRYRTFWYK